MRPNYPQTTNLTLDTKKNPAPPTLKAQFELHKPETHNRPVMSNRIAPSYKTAKKLNNILKKHLLLDGFGGLVVSVLASGSRVRGLETGRSRWIFLCSEKSTARLPTEGKSNNLSHVPALGHVKDPSSLNSMGGRQRNSSSSLLR
jgi:hypothetical protein